MTLVAVKHSIAELVMKSGVCLSVCGHSDVRLTSPPVLKLWGTQGYLWLPYGLTEVIKLIGVAFKQKIYFFSSNLSLNSLITSVRS